MRIKRNIEVFDEIDLTTIPYRDWPAQAKSLVLQMFTANHWHHLFVPPIDLQAIAAAVELEYAERDAAARALTLKFFTDLEGAKNG